MQQKYDFIIIGTGLAGLYTALEASKYGSVALLTKEKLNISSSYWAQGGIASAIGSDDNPSLHYEDTMEAGRNLCNIDAVKVLVNEGIDRIRELINLGAPFDRENGEITLGREGGHNRRRILHAGGDATGTVLLNFVIKIVKNIDNIKIFENNIVHKLIIQDSVCRGVYVFNWENNLNFSLVAKSTIIAAGGATGIFHRTTNPPTSTGDGIAISYEAGAIISNMEFIQFHPTAFYNPNGETFLVSEAIRGEGAYLLDEKGERFLLGKHELAELAPRDVVARSIYEKIKQTNVPYVYLDLRHLDGEKIKNRFSNIYQRALAFDIDISKDLVPVAPAAHYMIGGIKTNLYGETNIDRLYACGEVAYTGIHGANRLASNSLLECLVFGKRTVDSAIKYLSENDIQIAEKINFFIDQNWEKQYLIIKNKISELMTNNTGIIRSQETLQRAKKTLIQILEENNLNKEEYYQSRLLNIISTGLLIINGALARKESRGAHYRSDYPKASDEFIKYSYQKKGTSLFYGDVN